MTPDQTEIRLARSTDAQPRQRTLRPPGLRAAAGCLAAAVAAGFSVLRGSTWMSLVAVAVAILGAWLSRMAGSARDRADRDPLTGLGNRNLLDRRLRRVLATGNRRGTPTAVLFLDVDRFKQVNDTMGHAAGDELLIAIARRMTSSVRSGDLCARFAGDEFVIVLANATEQVATLVADRLMITLGDPVWFEGVSLIPSVSIGIAVADRAGATPDGLLRAADTAMYCAKEQRGGFEIFTHAMQGERYGRLEIERALRESDDDRFHVRYQPVMRTDDRTIAGFEAFVRWEDDRGETVLPAGFLDVAEQTGEIVRIGSIVLRSACEFIVRWNERHSCRSFLCVNLSLRELLAPTIVEDTARVLADSGVRPSELHFEVPGNVLDDELAKATLLRLAALGVNIDLAELGTSSTTLDHLGTELFGLVKLHRTLIDGIARTPRAQAIVRGVVATALELHLEVVAEGVEDAEDLELVADLGCTFAQGWAISTPKPSDDWLGDHVPARGLTGPSC